MMVIVITGATSGIGAALARAYAAPGRRLYLCGRRQALLDETASHCRTQGASVETRALDVNHRDAMAQWLLEIDQEFPVDLLIANAGVADGLRGGDFESAKATEKVFATNLWGSIHTVMPLLPNMVARRSGQIVLMSSVAGILPLPMTPSYSASKAALLHWGIALRGSLSRHGIRVNVICPGYVRSPMTDANRFAMPLLMDMETAVARIQKGIRRNRAVIAFPAVTVWLVRLVSAMPARWVPFVYRRLLNR